MVVALGWGVGACAARQLPPVVPQVLPVLPPGWHTDQAKIRTPDGQEFRIEGINWSGFETSKAVAEGLDTLDYEAILARVAEHGFNTIRIPLSNEMWQTNPKVDRGSVSACHRCQGKSARDVLALIINHAGTLGLHVILDNHRSSAGNGVEPGGLWYTEAHSEERWIEDWRAIQAWVYGAGDARNLTPSYLASDGHPIVLGFDLRDDPHATARGDDKSPPGGATWGTGDGIDPTLDPNPNPFAPECVADSSCRDWRLAAERAGTTLLGDAAANGWPFLLMFVQGVRMHPAGGSSPDVDPGRDGGWGSNLAGVRGSSTRPGAPVVYNAGGDAQGLMAPVPNQVVYAVHEHGPTLDAKARVGPDTCYASSCAGASLASYWYERWAYLTHELEPVWPGHETYPWASTGHTPQSAAPVFISEFGTGNDEADLFSTGSGSRGQWFTGLVSFIQSSSDATANNESGVPVSDLHWAYWALNPSDERALLTDDWSELQNDRKVDTFLCAIQSSPPAGCRAESLPQPDVVPPPPPPPPKLLHVQELVVATAALGGSRYRGMATLRITDAAEPGEPVPGATVSARFSGPAIEAVTGTTNASGEVELVSSTVRSSGEWSLCTTNVVLAEWTYEPGPEKCE